MINNVTNELLDIEVAYNEEILFKENCLKLDNEEDLSHEIRINLFINNLYNENIYEVFNEESLSFSIKKDLFRLRFEKWRKNLKWFSISNATFYEDEYYHRNGEINLDNKFALDLSNFDNLETIFVDDLNIFKVLLKKDNKIESICLRFLANLEYFDFINLNPESLTRVFIEKSPNFVFDIEHFSMFKNLESINVSFTKAKGSLRSLEKIKSLESISFDNTNIDFYIECLQDKAFINHENNFEIENNSSSISKFLRKISSNFIDYRSLFDQDFTNSNFFLSNFSIVNSSRISVEKWKKANPQLITNFNYIIELEKIKRKIDYVFDINSSLINLRVENNRKFYDLYSGCKNNQLFEALSRIFKVKKFEKFNNNQIFQLIFNKDGIFSFWLNDEFKSLKKYQELYYQELIMNSNDFIIFNSKENLLNFCNKEENQKYNFIYCLINDNDCNENHFESNEKIGFDGFLKIYNKKTNDFHEFNPIKIYEID